MASAGLPEIDLEPGTLVIGDLHLDLAVPEQVERFALWLEKHAAAPRLVILGDLFEYWLGPTHADTDGGRRALGALASFANRGAKVDVIPGNRDFLLDESFERQAASSVRRAGMVGRTSTGARVLFLHGDELCTLDHGYQKLRRVLRSRPLTWLAPRLPRFLADRIARRLRRASKKAIAGKARAETEQQPDACARFAADHGAEVLVCGHAHRYRDAMIEGGVRWLVVDAFGGRRDTLVVGAEGGLTVLTDEGGAAQ